jgi:hypothetical protein
MWTRTAVPRPGRARDPGQGPLGLPVDPLRGDHDDAPLPAVDVLATVDVPVVLLRAVGVLAPVVLDSHLRTSVGEVEASQDVPEVVADPEVDLRLGQAGQREQHPQPALHRRVHVGPHETGRLQGTAGVCGGGPAAVGDQRGRRVPPLPTMKSPTTTRSTRPSRPASSTKVCAGTETRMPRTVTTGVPGAATWLSTPRRRRRSPGADTLTCRRGEAGTGIRWTSAALRWLANASPGCVSSATSTSSSAVTGVAAPTWTPLANCQMHDNSCGSVVSRTVVVQVRENGSRTGHTAPTWRSPRRCDPHGTRPRTARGPCGPSPRSRSRSR